ADTRSYKKTAKRFRIHQPSIRKSFRQAAKQLKHSNCLKAQALGTYLDQLCYRSTKPKQSKTAITLKDSPELGSFAVAVNQPGAEHLFESAADPNKAYTD